MKNCDENQNLLSRLNVFSSYARTVCAKALALPSRR